MGKSSFPILLYRGRVHKALGRREEIYGRQKRTGPSEEGR